MAGAAAWLATCLHPTAAIAAPRESAPASQTAQAEAFAAKGTERFKAGDYPRSAQLFMQAYALSHEPALVYNAARAYEEAGMAGEAVGLFRLYASLTNDADGTTATPVRPCLQPIDR